MTSMAMLTSFLLLEDCQSSSMLSLAWVKQVEDLIKCA